MEEQKNNKRVLSIELDDSVKKVSITGLGDDEKVVMKQDINEEEIDEATGGLVVKTPKCHPLLGRSKQCGNNIDY